MPALSQLKLDNYQPCTWDLVASQPECDYWIGHFIKHLDVLLKLIDEEYADADAEHVAQFRREYLAMMNDLREYPTKHGRLDVLLLDELRNAMLERFGFADPFHGVKARENTDALALLPELLDEIDRLEPSGQMHHLAMGLMAGNIFDLGAMATVERYHGEGIDFWHTRTHQPSRPWFIDQLDDWEERCTEAVGYHHAAFFVDNAGSDIVLGCLPFVRWLLNQKTRVTLITNTKPALNDILEDELRQLLPKAAEHDAIFASEQLSVISDGNTAPLIDLSKLTEECVDTTKNADLLIIHGMGRSIESNFEAEFTCDTLRTAVVKDPTVAKNLGCDVFDCVFRFAQRK